jgi:hypothetical protein
VVAAPAVTLGDRAHGNSLGIRSKCSGFKFTADQRNAFQPGAAVWAGSVIAAAHGGPAAQMPAFLLRADVCAPT